MSTITAADAIKQIQAILHVAEDGLIGPKTLQELTTLSALPESADWPGGGAVRNDEGWHSVKASSFADAADVAAFRKCKAEGGGDTYCFGRGDNGIGKWGDDCATGSGPACALPPEDWATWGGKARKKKVRVRVLGREVICELRDTMPHRANITNGAGIDLNPDAVAALGLRPPLMIAAEWQWAD
ncbi:hypothetical protein CfE428DRAFT_5524 [Chthoniobacter flavus Ellin428]|uniref:Uncharacterized protein n=1 Tax=Chthoniobacter flavus Ellin428 TaxID=497964 RepID=B4D9D4_9BACT|nr:hypothetical protein [Chthoniobacter flavus]EDY16895.1 hypothetical protein CfE428DRAFT_5524 [Chthoniobacter flavus Ellin428]TCO87777.1 hypothetical protein EV701_12076 [Chthoniobacter flavus]